MAKAFIDDTNLTNIANAIRSKNGTNNTYLPSQMASAIAAIPLKEKDVNFYDWEGTLLYSYTGEEAMALTSLPALPDRTSENLAQEGWNWTLPEIKKQLNDVGGDVNVGCTYHTIDGNTHIFVNVYSYDLHFQMKIGKSGYATSDMIIHWGDNTTTTVSSTTSAVYSHDYSQPGTYDIVIENEWFLPSGATLTDGKGRYYDVPKILLGDNLRGSMYYLFRDISVKYISISKNYAINNGTSFPPYFCYGSMHLKHVTMPRGMTTLSNFAFSANTKQDMMSISIPPTLTNIGTNIQVFYNKSLKSVTLPKGTTMTSTATNAAEFSGGLLEKVAVPGSITRTPSIMFSSAFTLREAILNEGIEIIGNNTFYYTALETITIPSTVTEIEASVFERCWWLRAVYLKPTAPPIIQTTSFPTTEGGASSATVIPDDCKFFVPRDSVAAYKSATNWNVIADRIQPYDFTIDQRALNFYMPNGGTITLSKTGTPTEVTLEYSLDNGLSWTTWTETNSARTLTLTAGQTVHIRNTSATQTGFSTGSGNTYIFGASGELWANGDIRSLLCKTPENVSVLGDNCFLNLFYGCGNLKSTPLLKGDVIGASSLMRTFRYCTGLELVRSFEYKSQNGFAACRGTFQGCTSLTSFPEIMIETVSERGLSETFSGCSNLKEIRTYMTNISAANATANWVSNVSAIGDLYCSSSLVLETGASGIPSGWTRHNLD